jgi:hypothetical protein
MPPLVLAVLIGAGAYAGYRAVAHVLGRALEGAADPVAGGGVPDGMAVAEKDLGPLVLDPLTGHYVPATEPRSPSEGTSSLP